MCSAENDTTTSQIDDNDDTSQTANADSSDTTETQNDDDTTSDVTNDSLENKDTIVVFDDPINSDTIYKLDPCPDTTIYGNQMFKDASLQAWATSAKGSGICFFIIGETYIIREDDSKRDSMRIVITVDSLLTDTMLVVEAIVPANDSLLCVTNIENIYRIHKIFVADTLINKELPVKTVDETSEAWDDFIISTHKNYLPSISRVTDDYISPTFYYSIFINSNYKITTASGNTDVLWDTIR